VSGVLLGLDIETWYPWPENAPDLSQPDTLTSAQLRRRRDDGKAHPWAKDPRRCCIRLLTVNLAGRLYLHDFHAEPLLPTWLVNALASCTLLGHNLDFDVTVLRRYGIAVSSHWVDTMLASRLLNLGRERGAVDAIDEEFDAYEQAGITEGQDGEHSAVPKWTNDPTDHSFGAVIYRYLSIRLLKDRGDTNWGGTLSAAQIEYALDDVRHCHRLWEVERRKLEEDKLFACFMERMRFAPILNTIKLHGLPINVGLCESEGQQADSALGDALCVVRALCSDRFELAKTQRKKVESAAWKAQGRRRTAGAAASGIIIPGVDYTELINPNKSEHITEALRKRGHTIADAKKKTLLKVDHPLAQALVAYSEAKARRTTLRGILRSIFPDSRVRAAGWNQLAARTGRIHSIEPNLQNLPRKWRYPFEAPPGWTWLKSDLEQIEMLLIGIHYKCQPLLDLLAAGKDVYVHLAAFVFGKQPVRGPGPGEVSEELRWVAKTLTLGISYCMGVRTFIKQCADRTGKLYTFDEAKLMFDRFFQMFPEIKAAQDHARGQVGVINAIYTINGQRRWLPPLVDDREPDSYYWPCRERIARIIVNTPIQGSSANLLIRAIIYLCRSLPADCAKIVNLVHDEVDLLVRNDYVLQAIALVETAFKQAFKEFYGEQYTVRMEHKWGPSWGKGTKYDPRKPETWPEGCTREAANPAAAAKTGSG
jgi:DNA polymerase-1